MQLEGSQRMPGCVIIMGDFNKIGARPKAHENKYIILRVGQYDITVYNNIFSLSLY